MSEPILPGPVASVLNLIYTAEDNETFFTALPNTCEDILRNTGGEQIFFNDCDDNGFLSEHGFIFLPPEKEHPGAEDFMQVHVQLEAGSDIIVKLIVRKDNIYLIGFCSKRGYFELRSGDRLLPTAELLNIDVNYHESLNIEDDDKREIRTRFSHQQLIAAIIALDNPGTQAEDLHHHLVVVIVMLLETTRFKVIREAVILEAVINRGLEPTSSYNTS